MSDTDLVIVGTFATTVEAEIAQSVLQAASIDAAIQADDCGGLYPNLQMGGVGLLVRQEDAAEATRVLATPAETLDTPSA
jgi:hypothetical protein